jgi:hypothetical protein
MLSRYLFGAAALLLAVGVALTPAQEARKRGKITIGQLEKCDLEKGAILVKLMKNGKEGDESPATEYQVNEDTVFVVNNGKGQKSTVFKTKKDFNTPEFKDKFKQGALVAVWLDPDGKVARRVVTNGQPKKPRKPAD